MPNRYFSNINGKLTAPSPPKEREGVKVQPKAESTANWIGVPGPVGPKRNKVNFREVKQSAKKKGI